MRDKLRVFSGTVVCLLLVVVGGVGQAVAADDPPGAGVDHSGEHFTLDGQPVSADVGGANGNDCAATPAPDGTVACYSSQRAMFRAQAAAVRAGGLPPGYLALPPGQSRAALARAFDNDASRSPSARAAQVSKRRPPKLIAKAADGMDCYYIDTHIWLGANFTSTQGQQGYTGVNQWANYSSTYDNAVSSFHASQAGWTSRWHDYAYGNGAYYGGGDPCRYVENLGNANMTDGGTANDRFSSFGDW